jgi:succinoglycan biosynthesis transport protein ExoP
MRFSQLMRILWAHRLTSIFIVTAVLAVAIAASLLLPKKYKAESAIVVDVRASDPLTQDGAMPAQLASSYLATQVDVIASHNVALKVIDRMKLANDPEFIRKFREATKGAGSIRDWGADLLLKSLTVRPSRDSNVIYIQFKCNDPQTAADITNAFADSYMQTSLELTIDPARRQAGWFDQQVNELRVALENAQHELSAYQGDHGVIGTDDTRLDVETARLTEISNHLVAAQAAMYDAETRQRQMNEALAKNRADASVNVLINPLLQNLKTELARSEAKFAEVAQRYDRNHPQYMSARAELESLRSKVATEVDNATATVAREAEVARQNTTDLQRAMEQQRKRILALQHNQDEYSVLKRDAESVRAAYDSALQRGGQTRLQSRLDQTNIAMLNRAFAPINPSSPLLLLNAALAVILGSMLAAGVSLTRERLDRRIHWRDDLLEGAGIAVLAELPRERALKRQRDPRLVRIVDRDPRVEPAKRRES